ncbi:hypothetical protein [Lachnoclostridium sp. MSJ-17]|uniref:hypothetical protein n=1 Tax=Lachnoclostridium sp. MSJ-17 TaxID=2841516 RepID=UPI001C110F2F|nr:hypothetical protein [Lachnoclostridium sp. MSJ-17]MBU5462024.1 hypothetical protein [Lachnoclostridium sp. MSJ-17]
MKTKRIISVAIAAVMAAVSAVSVSAAQLTESSQSGQTEVKARIEGAQPGDVSYIITIPDVVDFGTLTQPADSTKDSYKTVDYTVSLDKAEGLDADTQQISVYVKDENASVNGDQEFYIANKSDPTKKFKYQVFDVPSADLNYSTININRNTMTQAAGYFLKGFTTVGEEVNGSLVINQVQLCDYSLADIVGEYSGYMVFFSTIENQ